MKTILPTRRYQLICEHRPQYVYVGTKINNLEIAQSYWFEILTMLHRRNYRYVLIEKDAPPLCAADAHNLIDQLGRSGYGAVTLSICDRYYDKDRCDFEEFAAKDRGLDLCISSTVKEAETMLLAGCQSHPQFSPAAPPSPGTCGHAI